MSSSRPSASRFFHRRHNTFATFWLKPTNRQPIRFRRDHAFARFDFDLYLVFHILATPPWKYTSIKAKKKALRFVPRGRIWTILCDAHHLSISWLQTTRDIIRHKIRNIIIVASNDLTTRIHHQHASMSGRESRAWRFRLERIEFYLPIRLYNHSKLIFRLIHFNRHRLPRGGEQRRKQHWEKHQFHLVCLQYSISAPSQPFSTCSCHVFETVPSGAL